MTQVIFGSKYQKFLGIEQTASAVFVALLLVMGLREKIKNRERKILYGLVKKVNVSILDADCFYVVKQTCCVRNPSDRFSQRKKKTGLSGLIVKRGLPNS